MARTGIAFFRRSLALGTTERGHDPDRHASSPTTLRDKVSADGPSAVYASHSPLCHRVALRRNRWNALAGTRSGAWRDRRRRARPAASVVAAARDGASILGAP